MTRERTYPRSGLLGWLCVLKWEGMREQDRANERRVNTYAALWAASLIAVAALTQFLDLPLALDGALMALPAAMGLLCLRAYLRLLREADEMLRRIQFEAMAVGFGTGLIASMTFVVIEMPDTWAATIVATSMCFAFSLRVVLAAREVARDASDADLAHSALEARSER